MKKITPFLWFDANAYEAAQFYTGVFKNSKINSAIPGPGADAMTVTFELDGQEFVALNGGPAFTFNGAISFFINCDTQEEIDCIWNKLTADGGKEGMCGWVTDKYGVCWQVVPTALAAMLANGNTAKATNVMQAMMQMKKIFLPALQQAFDA